MPDPAGPLDGEHHCARRIGDRRMLVVLDNCEHLLDGCAALIVALLGACPALRWRPAGNRSRWPVSRFGGFLLGHGEAIELFTDRAGRS